MSAEDRKPVLVVGAGITGLSAAVMLARAGRKVEVWESRPDPGGLLAPVTFQGVPCDQGSHRVHPESHPLLRELTASEDWIERPRRGRLILGGKLVGYPPDPVAFLKGLGLRAAAEMGAGFIARPGALDAFRTWEQDRGEAPTEDVGFEDFVVRRVGRGAYRRFYRPYVEKVWGLDPSEVSQSVAKQRVSTSNPLQTFRRALRRDGTPDRTFFYPRRGMASLIDHLCDLAVQLGVEITHDRSFDGQTDISQYAAVLFSGHLTDLVPDSGLSHRGLYLLHLAFPAGHLAETDTWYAPEAKYWFGRVSQPAKFSSSLQAPDQDILAVEIPQGRWGTEHDFMQTLDEVVAQLVDAGILSTHIEPSDARQTYVPRVYPLYLRGWFDRWRAALESLVESGPIFPIGRQGLFLHCNMDHCVHIADEAVRHLQAGGTPQDWARRCTDFLDLRVRD